MDPDATPCLPNANPVFSVTIRDLDTASTHVPDSAVSAPEPAPSRYHHNPYQSALDLPTSTPSREFESESESEFTDALMPRRKVGRPALGSLPELHTCPIPGCAHVLSQNIASSRVRRELCNHMNRKHILHNLPAELNVILHQRGIAQCEQCHEVFPASSVRMHSYKCTANQETREGLTTDHIPAAPNLFEHPNLQLPFPNEINLLQQKRATHRVLPRSKWESWQGAARNCLAAYPRVDQPSRAILQMQFATLVHRHLPLVRSQNKRQRRSYMARTLREGNCILNSAKTEKKDPQDEERAAIRRATIYCRQGALTKACRTLMSSSSPISHTDEKTIEELHRLHPQEASALPQPPQMCDQCDHISEDEFMAALARLPKAASPGLDGWTRELLVPLTQDPTCKAGLISLLDDIINARISPAFTHALLAAECIPFLKPTGGLRPIDPESAILKLACHICLGRAKNALTSILSEHQFGVARRGGPEAAAHQIREALRLFDSNMSLDVSNAFNSISRASVLSELYSHCELQPMWHLANLMYGRPSELVVFQPDGKPACMLTSSRGVRQGCVFAMPLFCLAIDTILKEFGKMTSLCITAYADDINVTGPVEEVLRNYPRLQERLKCVGLDLNPRKTELLTATPSPLCPTTVWNAIGHAKILGTVMGWDIDGQKARLQAMVIKHKKLFELLAHPHTPTDVAYQLLRHCVAPKMTFLQRATPPDLMEEAVALFDDMYYDTVRRIIGDDIAKDQTAMTLSTLPLRVGGLGFRPASRIHDFAYLCSQDALGSTQEPSQHDRTKMVEDAIASTLPRSPTSQARIYSTSGQWATYWMTTHTNDPNLQVSPEAFRAGLRFRIGLQPLETMWQTCECQDPGELQHHAMTCPRARHDAKRRRHDLIKSTLATILAQAGFQVEVEPTAYSLDSLNRPDILLHVGPRVTAIDVSVTHPCSKTSIDHASKSRGSAARLRVAEKCTKYEKICQSNHHDFLPVVLETYGFVEDSFVKWVKALQGQAFWRSPFNADLQQRIAAGVSAALVEGNYNVLCSYLRQNRQSTEGQTR